MKARSSQPARVVRAARMASSADPSTQACSAMFLMRVTIGNQVASGSSHRTKYAHQTPAKVRPASIAALTSRKGATEAPVAGWLARAVVWRLSQARAQDQQTAGGGARAHRHQALFTRFTVLVEQHFLAHWPVARYASLLGLSVPRLNRLVQAEAGRNALELLHERLTREACRRLLYIAAPVAHLAAELGFDDPAYFCRFFKRRMGVSPHQFRQQHAV